MSKKKIAFFSFIILLIILASILSMVFATNENNTNLNNEKIDAEIKYLDEKFSNIYKELLIDCLRVDWNKMQEPIKEIYSSWNSIIIDLNNLQIKNLDLINFGKKVDEISIYINEKNTNNVLLSISDLYSLLAIYTNSYNSNVDMKNKINSKYYLIKAYSLTNTDNWVLINENIAKAEKINLDYITNIDNNYNISRIYVSIKELENSINIKNKEIFKMKLKIVLENLD